MTHKTLFTAVGRFERRTNGYRYCCPIIILGEKEYMVDLQEMIIWSCLNWRIAHMEEIGNLYAKMLPGQKNAISRPWQDCVKRLLTRGLLVSGKGETEYDALYDLLCSLYIIPADGSAFLRMLSFLKLTLVNHVPFSAAKKLFRRDRRNAIEKHVMSLAKQALLSTAELIRCMDKDIQSLPTEESILERIYDDPDTTSDNIGYVMQISPKSKTVILAVANLYLRQQIIFERI